MWSIGILEAVSHEGLADRLVETRAVIEETNRLYPPITAISRAARGPDQLAGHPIARGTMVVIAPYVLHRHRALWVKPNYFDPGRFVAGAREAIDRFAYLPFGVGARICIGAHFALVEATLALARLVGAFRIDLADETPIMPTAVVTTQPDRSPPFLITPR